MKLTTGAHDKSNPWKLMQNHVKKPIQNKHRQDNMTKQTRIQDPLKKQQSIQYKKAVLNNC